VTGERELRLNIKLYETQINKLPDLLALPDDLQHQRSAVLLTITDNGCGMDENTMNRLFEPFFTTKPVGQGTGMGLAMAYGTVQSHGGAIGISSQPGIGTKIYIVLPKLVS
jgi:signal transduction histidine kinase